MWIPQRQLVIEHPIATVVVCRPCPDHSQRGSIGAMGWSSGERTLRSSSVTDPQTTTQQATAQGNADHTTHSAIAQTSPLLGSLDHEERSELVRISRTVHLERGETLLRPEDDLAAVVLSGVAVAAVIGHGGIPVIVGFLGPGAATGFQVVVGQPEAGIQATALTPTDALLLRGADLRERVVRQPNLAFACLRVVTARLAEARNALARDANTSTTQRIVERLVELGTDWGEVVEGEVRVTIPLTQDMIASWALASRESTARVLHDLRERGIIRTGRRELTILDMERLSARSQPARALSNGLLRDLIDAIST
jgi:CRP/FNR family transcriptional regulator, cyclic AMP receptor protein